MNAIDPAILEAARARLAAIRVPTVAAPPQPKLTLAEILAQQQAAAQKKADNATVHVPSVKDMEVAMSALKQVEWNQRQGLAIEYAQQGKSFCLIGAAGTGKTTTLKGCIQMLQASHLLPPLTDSSKYLQAGAPGIVFVSYTRRAVRQIARQLPKDIAAHALTIHKLLEFEPIFEEVELPNGEVAKRMRFVPMRNGGNPLPNIRTIVVDESSMVSVELFNMIVQAMSRGFQVIFLGDLHQLPPVYGEAVLANKLQELPVVELTEVYRQALDSPIIKLATMVKNGDTIPLKEKIKWSSPDGKSNVTINPWPRQLDAEDALMGLAGTIKNVINTGHFNEEEDVILMPFNKSCGTLELNLHIAQTLGNNRGATVHHVIAGREHWYLAVGDRLLVDKQDCVLEGIDKNPKYVGKAPLEPATTLDRWGTYQDDKVHHYLENDTDEDVDELLQRMADNNVEDKVNQATHVLVLKNLDTGVVSRISEVGTLNNMVFSYALTVHKSQGSEWRRVFLFLHSSHHAMCSRELVYTAVTRAREDLIIICEPDRVGKPGTLTKAAKNPRIKGNTLEEKLAWLKARSNERIQDELV